MMNLRRHGKAPFAIVVVHGGPGAGGEMAPVARELASDWGVLEPIQTATSLKGQVEELRTVLERYGDLPVTLIGFSWGAWLSFIVSANYPSFVKKLILIGCGPYEEKYAARIQETRLSRLSGEERLEASALIEALDNPAAKDKNPVFARFGTLFSKTDAYDPLVNESEEIDYRADIFQGVWKNGAEMRRSGRLLKLGNHIKCPVVAIHGDYDSHPAEGVEKPLSVILKDFRFVLLEHCGHKPWIERHGREEFFRILREEVR